VVWIGLGDDKKQVDSSFENGSCPSGSVKSKEFADW